MGGGSPEVSPRGPLQPLLCFSYHPPPPNSAPLLSPTAGSNLAVPKGHKAPHWGGHTLSTFPPLPPPAKGAQELPHSCFP